MPKGGRGVCRRCHRPNQLDGLRLLRSTVDQIADKDGGTAGMTPHTIGSVIAQTFEERNQFVILAVDVADDVKAHLSLLVSSPSRAPKRPKSILPVNHGPEIYAARSGAIPPVKALLS